MKRTNNSEQDSKRKGEMLKDQIACTMRHANNLIVFPREITAQLVDSWAQPCLEHKIEPAEFEAAYMEAVTRDSSRPPAFSTVLAVAVSNRGTGKVATPWGAVWPLERPTYQNWLEFVQCAFKVQMGLLREQVALPDGFRTLMALPISEVSEEHKTDAKRRAKQVVVTMAKRYVAQIPDMAACFDSDWRPIESAPWGKANIHGDYHRDSARDWL